MSKFNARVAIFCDVEVEMPDTFDSENFESEEFDVLMDKIFKATPEPYDTQAGRVVEACGYEIMSVWDEEKDIPIYDGE